MTPQTAAISARLKALARQINSGALAGPPRPANAATQKQIRYLLSLRQSQKTEYDQARAALGITEPLHRLTRREAWLLTNRIVEGVR